MKMRAVCWIGTAATSIALAGCATQPPAQPAAALAASVTLVRTGQITDIRDVAISGGHAGGGAGSLVGGVLGAIAGSTIGDGYGRAAATIGGTVAGSMAGQQAARSAATTRAAEINVRFTEGDVRIYRVDAAEKFRVGDMVTVTTSDGVVRISH
jgi:outer membrane lipoprotein SlyB